MSEDNFVPRVRSSEIRPMKNPFSFRGPHGTHSDTLVVWASRLQTRRESRHEDELPQLRNGSAHELQLHSTGVENWWRRGGRYLKNYGYSSPKDLNTIPRSCLR